MIAETDVTRKLLTPTAYAHETWTEPGTDDWLEVRRTGTGGSDVPAILGDSPFKDAFTLYLEKKRDPYILATEAAQPFSEPRHFGNLLEPLVVAECARRVSEKTGRAYRIGHLPLLRDAKCDYRLANLDAVLYDADDDTPDAWPVALVEAKNTGLQNLAAWRNGPPAAALDQVMHYLLVTGLPRAYLACLVAGQKFFWYEVLPDEGMFEKIATAEAEFWDRVQRSDPPMPTGAASTTQFLRDREPHAEEGTTLELSTTDDAALLHEYRIASIESGEAAQRMAAVANRLRDRLHSYEAATINGRVVATYKSSDVTRLDQKKLKADEPELYQRFEVTKPQRTLRVM